MNLTSVKYQDSCIYIGLDGSYEQESHENSLEEIKNVYAVYKIKANDNYVQDTILIRKNDITAVKKQVIVKFELNQLHRPEECEIEIVSLKFVYISGKRENLTVKKSYSFLEIRVRPPIATNKDYLKSKIKLNKKSIKKPNNTRAEKNILSVSQEVIVLPPEVKTIEAPKVVELSLKKEIDIDQGIVNQDEITTLSKLTHPSDTVLDVEAKIELKLNAQTKKLEKDMKQLCYETIDALLTVLPQPEFAEDYRSSNAMVQSIHKYITCDLLQREQEEGESA